MEKQLIQLIKSSYNNNKLKISALTWNDKFELPDGSYSASDIQDPIILSIFKKNIIKTGYYLELLTLDITWKH